jgi:hypothetical protein
MTCHRFSSPIGIEAENRSTREPDGERKRRPIAALRSRVETGQGANRATQGYR